MRRTSRAWTAAAVATAGITVMVVATATPAIATSTGRTTATGVSPDVTVVASGLNDPKQISFGPGGLYVTESGTGGSSCLSIKGTSYCDGETGAVLLLGESGTRTVLSGLPSVEDSSEGTLGVASVTWDRGKLAVVMQDAAVTKNGSTAVRGPGADMFGKLFLAQPFGGSSSWSVQADLAAFAAAHPQNAATLGGIPGEETTYDSDPYAIVPYRGGYAIADAAANDVLWLSPGGSLCVLDRLPTVPETVPAGVLGPKAETIDSQAVPTSLAVGPDGALYVGTLPGFPANVGTASIYRLVPGQAPTVAVKGLTEVSAIAFDNEGRLLALEFNTGGGLAAATVPGALVRVSRSGSISTLPVSGLAEPTGLAVAPDGTVYVGINGNAAAGTGEVLKITGLG